VINNSFVLLYSPITARSAVPFRSVFYRSVRFYIYSQIGNLTEIIKKIDTVRSEVINIQ